MFSQARPAEWVCMVKMTYTSSLHGRGPFPGPYPAVRGSALTYLLLQVCTKRQPDRYGKSHLRQKRYRTGG